MAPIDKSYLGKFETYVYTPNQTLILHLDLFVEFKWLGKNVDYVRDKNIKDGGMVYWNRPLPSNKIYKDNISILVKLYENNMRKILLVSGCSNTEKDFYTISS